MSVLAVRRGTTYDPAAALTGKETQQDAERMELQAVALEAGGKHMDCLQLMEKALQIRCRECVSGTVTQAYIAEACEAAERLVTKSNAHGVKCFKGDDYDTASTLFGYTLEMTEPGSFPLREADDRRRYLRGVTLNNYGCMERRRGHFTEALSYMQRSMECTGEQSPVAFLNMSAVQTQLRLCEDAAESAMLAMQSLGSAPEDPSLLAVAHHNLAMALEPLDPTRALEEYQAALALAQSIIGKESETTLTIERNMMRFTQTNEQPKTGHPRGGSLALRRASNSMGRQGSCYHNNTTPASRQGVQPRDEDIFPHPFMSSAADAVERRKVIATRMYHPPVPARRSLAPVVPKNTRSQRNVMPDHMYSQVRQERNVPPPTIPPRRYEASRVHSTRNPTRLPPMAAPSREAPNRASTGPTSATTAAAAAASAVRNPYLSQSTRGAPKNLASAATKHTMPSSPMRQSSSVPHTNIPAASRSAAARAPSRDMAARRSSLTATAPTNRVSTKPAPVVAATQPSHRLPVSSDVGHKRTSISNTLSGYAKLATPTNIAAPAGHTRSPNTAAPSATTGRTRSPNTAAPSATTGHMRSPNTAAPSATTGHMRSPNTAAPSATTGHMRSPNTAAPSATAGHMRSPNTAAPSATTGRTRSPNTTAPTATTGRTRSPNTAAPSATTGRTRSSFATTSGTTALTKTPPSTSHVAGHTKSPVTTIPASGPATQSAASPVRPLTDSQAKPMKNESEENSKLAGIEPHAEKQSTFPVSARRQTRSRANAQGANLISYMSDRLDLLVVDEAELERKNASASIIQRAFRMYESRKLGKEMREGRGRDHALSELRESIAARKVQRWIRRSLGGRWDTHRRNKNREILASERHQAAIRIQSGARRWLAQRLFKRRKYYVQNSGCAAVAVQLWWRKILAKRKLIDLKRRHEEAKAAAAERERRELAATLIQSHWRTRKAERQTREERMRAKKFRRKQEEARRLSAACNIQTWWRWLKARAELQRLKEAQAIREARLREHQRKMDAATKLQSFGRMIIVRRAAEPLLTTARVNAARRIREKCTEYQAASKIQRAYRYHYAKRLLKRLREERRKALYEARCSVLVANVQRIGRGFCVRRDLGNVLREMAMEALEYHRRQEALEMADRAQEAAPTDEGIQVPVMAEGELCPAVEATEQQHFRMTQDERDTRPMLCPMPPGDVHHAVHTPSTEREVVQEQDVEESETDEEISDKRPSSAICRSVSKMLEEERQKRLREPEGEHVEAEREAPRVESLARSPSKMDDQEEERLSVPVELHEETIEEQQSFSQHKETEAFPAESTEEKETPEPCEDNDEVRAETRRLTVLRNAVAINDELEELERLYELEDAEEERDESRRLSALENAIAINDESQELKRLREVVEEEEEADNQLEAQALVTVSSSEEVPTVQRTLPPTDQKPLKTEELDQQQVLPEEPEPIGALEAALAVERKKRQESMAEEKRLRLARDALRAKANEYRLRQIAAAEKKEELQALIPRLPLERRRRELEMQTPENRPPRSSASLRELQLRRTMNAAIEKDRAALNITRVARGYLDRQYSQVLRRLTTEYIEYRVEMDLEEPPALDRELLQKFSEMHQEGVEKARGVRCVTAVQAFLRARESRKLTTHRAARVLPPLQTFLSAPPSLHDHAVVLCRFARVVLAKREVAARQQAVLACLQETRRMEALSTLRGFLHIVRAKQERAALRRVADASLQQEEAADALLNQAACKIAKFWRVMTAKIALQNRKKAVEERLRSGGAAEKVTVFLRLCCAKQELTRRKSQAKQQREVDIALETALDDAAMRVQRAYRTYKARQLAKQQRDAKQEHWKSIQAQDEEITAAMAAIAADATDQAEPWVNLEFYEMMQAEEEGEEEEDDDWEAEEFLYCIIAAQKFVRGLLARRKVRALREQLQQADKERQQREKEEGAKEEETKDPEPSCSGGEDPDHVAEL